MLKRLTVFALAFAMILAMCSGIFVAYTPEACAATTPVVLVDLQTKWKYLDTGVDPAGSGARTSWTTADFNDSGWKTSSGTA